MPETTEKLVKCHILICIFIQTDNNMWIMEVLCIIKLSFNTMVCQNINLCQQNGKMSVLLTVNYSMIWISAAQNSGHRWNSTKGWAKGLT